MVVMKIKPSISISKPVWDKLKRQAQKDEWSVSAMVEAILYDYLENQKRTKHGK